jgi:hypothetical protein
MTVHAAGLIHQGPMNPVLIEGFIHHTAMASPAQLKTSPSSFERLWRGRSFMALAAHAVGHRLMDIGKEYSRIIRTVRIVTGGAIRLGHRIIDMLLGKGRTVGFVALQTQGDEIIFQKSNRLSRGVRIMTIQASLFHRVMFEFDLRHCIANVFVTAKAKFVPSF